MWQAQNFNHLTQNNTPIRVCDTDVDIRTYIFSKQVDHEVIVLSLSTKHLPSTVGRNYKAF